MLRRTRLSTYQPVQGQGPPLHSRRSGAQPPPQSYHVVGAAEQDQVGGVEAVARRLLLPEVRLRLTLQPLAAAATRARALVRRRRPPRTTHQPAARLRRERG